MPDELSERQRVFEGGREAAALEVVVRAAREGDVPPVARAVAAADVPLIRASVERSGKMRGAGAALAVGCAVVLGLAAWMRPSARGMGTHEQLGLPPCGFLLTTGIPCPTCGMTSAFAWMMHGHPLRSVECQPLGALLCIGAMAAVVVGVWMGWTGRWLVVDWVRFSPVGLMVGIGATFFLAWGAKIAYGMATGALPYHR